MDGVGKRGTAVWRRRTVPPPPPPPLLLLPGAVFLFAACAAAAAFLSPFAAAACDFPFLLPPLVAALGAACRRRRCPIISGDKQTIDASRCIALHRTHARASPTLERLLVARGVCGEVCTYRWRRMVDSRSGSQINVCNPGALGGPLRALERQHHADIGYGRRRLLPRVAGRRRRARSFDVHVSSVCQLRTCVCVCRLTDTHT